MCPRFPKLLGYSNEPQAREPEILILNKPSPGPHLHLEQSELTTGCKLAPRALLGVHWPVAGLCCSVLSPATAGPAQAEAYSVLCDHHFLHTMPFFSRPWESGSFWPRDSTSTLLGKGPDPPFSILHAKPPCCPQPFLPPVCLLCSSGSLTASTRLLALPWNCLPWAPAWPGTVRDTGRALRMVLPPPPQGVGSPDQELQWMDGKLLLSFSLDSAPSSRRVGIGCGGQPRLPGVAGGVAQGLGDVLGEWLLWRRGLRPATANACGHTRNTGYWKRSGLWLFLAAVVPGELHLPGAHIHHFQPSESHPPHHDPVLVSATLKYIL